MAHRDYETTFSKNLFSDHNLLHPKVVSRLWYRAGPLLAFFARHCFFSGLMQKKKKQKNKKEKKTKQNRTGRKIGR